MNDAEKWLIKEARSWADSLENAIHGPSRDRGAMLLVYPIDVELVRNLAYALENACQREQGWIDVLQEALRELTKAVTILNKALEVIDGRT